MAHSDRFTNLELPNLDASVMLYGGYRGIQVHKTTMTPDMTIRVLEAIKEKIAWLYEKFGGDVEWLRSKCVSMQVVQNTSFLTMEEPYTRLIQSVPRENGQKKTVKTTQILFEPQGKQSW